MEDFNELINEINGTKSLVNDFAKFQYRNFEVMMSQIKPLLVKYQMDLHVTNNVQELCGEIVMGSVATLTNSKGEQRVTNAYVACDLAQKGLNKPQCFGVAQAYVNKQNLCNMFLLSGERDADSNEVYRKSGQDKDVEPQRMELSKAKSRYEEKYEMKIANGNVDYVANPVNQSMYQQMKANDPDVDKKLNAVVEFLNNNPNAIAYYNQKYNHNYNEGRYFTCIEKMAIYKELQSNGKIC